MPRVQVIADNGWVALDEYANPAQVLPEHARHCLADRIAWAVSDADDQSGKRQAVEDLVAHGER